MLPDIIAKLSNWLSRNRPDADSELQEIINMLRKRGPISASYDDARIEGHRPTVLIEDALKKIGGPSMSEAVGYWSQVCQVAGLENNVGDWTNARQQTAKAYERIRQALLITTDKDQILALLQTRVPIASDGAE